MLSVGRRPQCEGIVVEHDRECFQWVVLTNRGLWYAIIFQKHTVSLHVCEGVWGVEHVRVWGCECGEGVIRIHHEGITYYTMCAQSHTLAVHYIFSHLHSQYTENVRYEHHREILPSPLTSTHPHTHTPTHTPQMKIQSLQAVFLVSEVTLQSG